MIKRLQKFFRKLLGIKDIDHDVPFSCACARAFDLMRD